MQIYLVQHDGKVSQEAYQTPEEAREFIESRTTLTKFGSWDESKMTYTSYNNHTYEIHEIRVKGA